MTYNGEPVPDATISFKAIQTGPNVKVYGASGRTDSAGKYTLKTGKKEGAVAGEYNVTVIKTRVTPGDPSYLDTNSPNYGKPIPPEAESKTEYIVPQKFSKAETSNIRVTVKPGDNEIPIELKD